MPIVTKPSEVSLTTTQVAALWLKTIELRNYPDEEVAIACLTTNEIAALNGTYRGKNAPTNVLTFSYPPDAAFEADARTSHDVALCLTVAQKEAVERNILLNDYIALLLAHAFLHITGLDHESSSEARQTSQKLETTILAQCGFTPLAL